MLIILLNNFLEFCVGKFQLLAGLEADTCPVHENIFV